MSIISESVLKTLAIAGLVGAGTIAINVTVDEAAKKAKERKALEAAEEQDEDEVADDVAEVQECKELPKETITLDPEKLKSVLLSVNYPAEYVDAFVNQIEKEAKPDEKTVVAEVLKDEPKAPSFTVVKEDKKQPDLKAKSTVKKSTNKKEDK